VTRDLDHGDLICLLKGTNMLLDCRHEGRLDDNDVDAWEQQASQSCHRVRETVKGDPACAPILTAEAHASRANLGWCGGVSKDKVRAV